MESDLPVPSAAVQAEMEEEQEEEEQEQEQEQELDNERQGAEAELAVHEDLEKEGGFDIGGADSVALSKGGTISGGERQTDGVAEGGESAPSFEKVRIDVIDVIGESYVGLMVNTIAFPVLWDSFGFSRGEIR